ncbi:MAG: sulfite exporter TauE/SafE family protein [Helicobacter sp.]|mgnify:CR=1 FL=1|nr:sulfite exporter TauE/SafE family protein [Helicobacter sp.]
MGLENAILIFVSTLGLAFSHCVGMCGGIVIAYSRGKMISINPLNQILLHGLYTIGRISSYAFLGVLAWFIGASLSLTNAYFYIFLGGLLIFLAFSYTFFPKILSKLEPNLSKVAWFSALFGYFLRSKSKTSFYALGVLNGFLPCGMSYFFALNALSFGSIEASVLSMVIFGIATSVPLLLIGFVFGSGFRAKFAKAFKWLGFICMLGLGSLHVIDGVQILNGKEPHVHSPLLFAPDPDDSSTDHHHHHHHH